ncbi:hypothetical protein [Hyphococcus sp.]|jgi:hypothetical protein|uniref:hypothetical protein n=1 Tax=Hyphococcus sp. TaxID=2038636 RepID=UPI003D0C0CD0
MSDVQPHDATSSQEAGGRGRKVATILIYLLLGPPVGGMIFAAFFSVSNVYNFLTGSSANQEDLVSGTVGLFVLAMPFSYMFGGLQAAMTGVIIAICTRNEGRFGYGLAFLASLVSSLVGAVIFGRDAVGFGVILVVVGVLSSLVLRFLFRKVFREDISAQNET